MRSRCRGTSAFTGCPSLPQVMTAGQLPLREASIAVGKERLQDRLSCMGLDQVAMGDGGDCQFRCVPLRIPPSCLISSHVALSGPGEWGLDRAPKNMGGYGPQQQLIL